MPFGLYGATATFQKLVNKLLGPHSGYAAAYIDDVIIFSQSWEEDMKHLEAKSIDIRSAGLTINPEKCHVGMQSTQYLRFIVGQGEVKLVISKVQAITQVFAPSNKKEVQRFLGMVGYYGTFITQFSEKVSPLTDCICGKRVELDPTMSDSL